MTRGVRLVIVGAFLLKGLVMPLFGYGDLWVIHDVARGEGHSDWNLYRGVEETLKEPSPHPPEFVAAYGPMAYYPLYGYHAALELFGLEDPATCDAVCELREGPLAWALIAKIPYLAVDAAVALALLRLLPAPSNRRAAVLWSTSPALFFVTYLEGQIDLVTSGMIVVALVFMLRTRVSLRASERAPVTTVDDRTRRRDDALAMVMLGLGTSMKVVPVFFGLVFVACSATRPREAGRNLAVLFGTVFATMLPFLGSSYFLRSFVFSDRGGDLFAADIQNLSPFFLLIVLPAIAVRQSRLLGSAEGLLVGMLSTAAALSLFTNSSAQRGLYLVTAVIIVAAFTDRGLAAAVAASAVVFLYPIQSTAMAGELLVQVSPIFSQLPPLQELSRDPQIGHAITAVARSVGIAAGIWVLLPLVRAGTSRPAARELFAAVAGTATVLFFLAAMFLPAGKGLAGPDASGDRYPSDHAESVVRQEFDAVYDRLDALAVTLDPGGRNVGEGLVLRLYRDCADESPLRTVRASHLALFTGRTEEVTFAFPSVDDAQGRRFCFALDLRAFASDTAPTVIRAREKPLAPVDIRTNDVVLFEDRYAFPLGSAFRRVGASVGDEWSALVISLMLGAAAGTTAAGTGLTRGLRVFRDAIERRRTAARHA